MLTKIYSISMLLIFFSVDLNKCSNNPDTAKITAVGTAIVIKHQAAVRTDDSLLYYLDGIDDWDVKYKGKRVKVTGKLLTLGPSVIKNPNPTITIHPQPRLRDGIILTKAKWRLVE
jgi:hypothetical protein